LTQTQVSCEGANLSFLDSLDPSNMEWGVLVKVWCSQPSDIVHMNSKKNIVSVRISYRGGYRPLTSLLGQKPNFDA